MSGQLVFGRVPAGTKARQRRAKPEVKVLYFRSLFDAKENDEQVILPPAEQPVQLCHVCLLASLREEEEEEEE